MKDRHTTDVSDDLDDVFRGVVSDLQAPRRAVFWADLIACAAIGWASFAAAVATWSLSGVPIAASVTAGLALYRGLCFVHELTHLRRGAIPGFETAWNVLFGVPLLLPSFTYVGVHQSHHNLSTYGTPGDPEYLPFARSQRLIILFAIQASLVTPIALVIRFLLLSPIGLIWPRCHRWLEVHASSFSMNPSYRRIVAPPMSRQIRVWETITLAAWGLVLVAMSYRLLPLRLLVVWYAVIALISFLNTARVLGAHAYESDGNPLNRKGQLADSIDTPGRLWSALWAPVGLRYHALHHFYPGIPYHNLGAAYRRVMRVLPENSAYRRSTSPSLPWSLRRLYATARRFALERRSIADSPAWDDAFRHR
jgi:fatty acid desaturase